jgi:hypothetical protein
MGTVYYIVKREREDGTVVYLTNLDQWSISRRDAERFAYRPKLRIRGHLEFEEVAIPSDPSERLRFDVYWRDRTSAETAIAAADEIDRLRAAHKSTEAV